MAEYLPPTENLPKFNEFVFDDPYSIEGLDRRVVHKAGTETITGNKTITGTFTSTNKTTLSGELDVAGLVSGGITATSSNIPLNTDLRLLTSTSQFIVNAMNNRFGTSTGYNELRAYGTGIPASTGVYNMLEGINQGWNYIVSDNYNHIRALSNPPAGFTAFNKMTADTGYNLISTKSSVSTGLASQTNQMESDGKNVITSAEATATANLIDATTALGGNTIRTTTGTNLLTTTSGSNTMLGGGGGSNTIERTSTGNNTIKTATGTNTIQNASTSQYGNYLVSTGSGGGNYIEANNGGGNRLVASGGGGGGINSMVNVNNTGGDANIISCSSAGGGNTLRTTTGTNSIETTTGRNTLTTAGTNATANLIDATGAGGGNTIRATHLTGTNTISATGGGLNTITTTTGTNTIQNTGGSNLITALSTGTNTIQSVSGKNLITSTSGLIELSTANTTASGILIKNTDTTTGGIRIENDGATGGIVIDTASGADMTLSQAGSTKFSISGAGASQATNVSGGVTTIAGTTTNIQSTSQPLTLSTTTGGKIEIKTNVLTATGINIENTNTTTGGITIKTNGSTGDVNITSADDVILTASSGQITLTSPIVSASSKYQLSTAPLISFCMVFIPEDRNTTTSQLGVGYPDANNTSVNISFRVPYNCRVVGWGLTGNAQAHSAVTMTFKINTGLGSTGGTTYFSQTGVLIANGLTSSSAVANISSNWGGFSSIGTASPITTMSAGDRFYAWIGSSANMANDFIVQVYFQQVV